MQNDLPKTKDLNLSETEMAWLAGLFEGEAYFGLDNRSATRYKVSTTPMAPYIRISMVDEDVIAKVSRLVNKIYFSPSRLTSTKKKVYVCHIGDRLTLKYLLPRLVPYMGLRRQKTILNCLKTLDDWEVWYLERKRKKMA
uniref:Putative LAGLIDADG homing endonuclease n=1 Tax=Hazenia capsulata TaxID=2202518 RepID=A0A1W6EHL1_9CHLO|nr:putative LAGLIDADG homing endonuclease [Hazenia capsulata]ARK14898.1 putative LAGLIDADG homing endonuclease [Hazenia capsulata]